MPIPEPSPRDVQFRHSYHEFVPFVTSISDKWPASLSGLCHLDPDFAHLTYGDLGSRARRIREFIVPDSFIVFWAALRWIDGPQAGELVCSIIGFYRVSHVLEATDVGRLDGHRNAHTRYLEAAHDNVVVFADPRESGRLDKHIPIGERRRSAQRVFPDLLTAWGGLRRKTGELLKDGYIQRGGSPPIFNKPQRFLNWFRRQRPKLIHANNIAKVG